MMRNWTGKIIMSDGAGWMTPRFMDEKAGGLGEAGRKILARYWKALSHSEKVRLVEVRLTLTRGEKVKAGEPGEEGEPGEGAEA